MRTLLSPDGYTKLLARRTELSEELLHTQREKSIAFQGDSNTWHDNAAYDNQLERETMLRAEIANIDAMIDNSTIVDNPKTIELVCIGHKITLRFPDNAERFYIVSDINGGDLKTTPPRISYMAPLIKPFFGKPVGYRAEVILGGNNSEIELVSIAM